MADEKKLALTLDTPEPRQSLTVVKASMATLHFESGMVELHCRKETADGSEMVGIRLEFIMDAAELKVVERALLDAAVADGKMPVGVISDV
jgi:hypothetical protein